MNIAPRRLGSICLYEVFAEHWLVENVDNNLLATQVMAQQNRLSNDPRYALFEDTAFSPEVNTEGYKLLTELGAMFTGKGFTIQTIWSQIHRPLESTSLHNHEGNGAAAAFVYYVAVPPGAGVLCFEFEGGMSSITPQVGHLYMFPAWAKHKVAKNMGSDVRISISGNLIHA
jgi:hypothetical protein